MRIYYKHPKKTTSFGELAVNKTFHNKSPRRKSSNLGFFLLFEVLLGYFKKTLENPSKTR